MLAIIPARKGSKGITNKNTKVFCGKPLISWTIEVLLKSKHISSIFVSTDDLKVKKICEKYNIEIPFLRPTYLATDSSLAIDVYKHTIKKINQIYKKKVETFLVALPTSPLREVRDINNSIKLFNNLKAESLISCREINFPIEWSLKINKNKKIKKVFNILDQNINNNRQFTDKTYIPNGSIYIFKHRSLLKNNSYYSKNTIAYLMPKERSVDIDTLEDFKYAEYLYKKNQKPKAK